MISLATFSSSRISPEMGEAKPAPGAKGGFSALLARQEPEQAEGTEEKALADEADGLPGTLALSALIPGIALPEAAEGGKELPGTLPGTGEDIEPEAETAIAEGEAALAAEAVLALAIAPQAAVTAGDEPSAPAETGAAAARPAMPQPAPAQAPAGEPAGSAPRETSVALHVGQPGGSEPMDGAMNNAEKGDTEGDAPATRRGVAAERTLARTAQPEASRLPEQAVSPVPVQPAAITAAPVREGALPSPRIDALQELTRIVDRLAAAREVFAPAAEALAIEHAEFGELSLRFDQRRDGGLSVQLSASNPEAHRAVAQAVGAQSFQSAADDRAGAGQSQNQPQGSAARGGADRESGSGNGNAARHDQSTPQQQRRAAEQQPGAGRPRTGIFA